MEIVGPGEGRRDRVAPAQVDEAIQLAGALQAACAGQAVFHRAQFAEVRADDALAVRVHETRAAAFVAVGRDAFAGAAVFHGIASRETRDFPALQVGHDGAGFRSVGEQQALHRR
ncbi:hypothetical protein D3C71_1879310 [compost metagenome]